jgi:hypothetical protein
VPHTVVSTDGVFKSKVPDTDETFSYTFTKVGAYPYYCSVHPKMTGQVVVQRNSELRIVSPLETAIPFPAASIACLSYQLSRLRITPH